MKNEQSKGDKSSNASPSARFGGPQLVYSLDSGRETHVRNQLRLSLQKDPAHSIESLSRCYKLSVTTSRCWRNGEKSKPFREKTTFIL